MVLKKKKKLAEGTCYMDKNETGIFAAFISLSDCAPILHEEILRSNLHNFLFIQYKEIKYILALFILPIPS